MASATYTLEHPQVDGRRRVRETHVDDFGLTTVFEYGPTGDLDYTGIMSDRAAAMAAERKSAEIAGNISSIIQSGSAADPVFVRSTKAENIGPLREAFRSADREASIMIADYLSTLTDANLRNILGKTQAEVAVLRDNKLTPAADVAAKIRAARGE